MISCGGDAGQPGTVRMIRTRAWKYIHRHPYGPHELYDLAIDPWETVNLVEDPARAASARTCAPRWRAGSSTMATRGGTAAGRASPGLGQVGLAGLAARGRESYRQARHDPPREYVQPSPSRS